MRPRGDAGGVRCPPPGAQHWLQGDDVPPVARRASRDNVAPVGVGGVTMMEGTCRCFSPGAGTPPLPVPLLTHVFKPLRQDNLSPMFSSSWRGLAAAHGSPAPLPAPAAKRERQGLRETTGNGAGDALRKEEPELAGQERAPPRLCARIEININIEAPERGELLGHNRKPCRSAEKPRADVTARR